MAESSSGFLGESRGARFCECLCGGSFLARERVVCAFFVGCNLLVVNLFLAGFSALSHMEACQSSYVRARKFSATVPLAMYE